MWVVPGRTASPSRSARPTSACSKSSSGRVEAVDRPARPEPQVGGDLVVARAAGVEPAGDRPDPLGQRRLEVQVDVLERPGPTRAGRPRRPRRARSGRSTSASTSSSVRRPARPRPRTWAIEPAMSSAASSRRRRSTRERRDRASFASLNRPPQSPHRPSVRCAAMLAGRRAGRFAWSATTEGQAGAARAGVTGAPAGARATGLRPASRRHRTTARRRSAASSARQVALGLGEQLVADHELADVRAQQRRIEVGVDLPAVGRARRRTAPGASPSSTGTAAGTARRSGRAAPCSATARSSRAASSRSVRRAAGRFGMTQRLERPGRPERDDDQPLVGLDD